MRAAWLVVVTSLFACKSPSEMIVEAATGGQVDIEKGTITVKGEDGETVTIISDDAGSGKVTVKGEDGKTVTITSDDEGSGKITVKGEDGEEMTISGKEGQGRIESKEGVVEWGGKLPADFPLPLISGAEIATSGKHETKKGTKYNLVANVDKKVKEIADFYTKALKEEGFKVKRVEHNMGGSSMVTLSGRKKKAKAAVTVMHDKSGKTMLTIAITPK